MKADYSGKFVLRVSPDLHRRLNQEATAHHRSLNYLCVDLLKKALDEDLLLGKDSDHFQKYQPVVVQLRKKFKSSLLGVLIFGSQVTREATSSSDVDLFVVVDASVPIQRSLYRWWDEEVTWKGTAIVNPHFVHVPSSVKEAGSLWFEVALAHEVLWQNERRVPLFLEKLKEAVEDGRIRRHLTQGQPYWVWKDHEKQDARH